MEPETEFDIEAARELAVKRHEESIARKLEAQTAVTVPETKPLDHNGPLDPEAVQEEVRANLFGKIASAHSVYQLVDVMPRTDTDAYELAAEALNGRLLFVDDNWYTFDGRCYVVDQGKSLVTKVAKAITRAIVAAHPAAEARKFQLAEEGEKVNEKMWTSREGKMKSFGDASKRSSVRRLLESEFIEDGDVFKSNRYIAMRNLVIDTVATREQGELVTLPHDPALHVPNRCFIDQDYTPGALPGPALSKFLDYSFEDRLDGENLFRALAVAIFSSAPKRKLFVDIYGPTNSGKSAASKIIRRLSGLYKTANRDHFGAGDGSFAFKSLQTYRAIFAHEVEYKLDAAKVKIWSGGDPIETDVKNGERIEYNPEGILFFISNRPTGVNIDMTSGDANHNRYFPVPTPHRFYAEAELPEGTSRDYLFDDTLEAEKLPAEDQQTISWMIDLWVAWEKLKITHIPLTDNQEATRRRKGGDLDMIDDAIEWYSGEREVLLSKSEDEVSNKRMWASYAEFRKLIVTYGQLQDIEVPSKADLLNALKNRGMVEYYDQYRLPGYVLGAQWKQALAELEAERSDGGAFAKSMGM